MTSRRIVLVAAVARNAMAAADLANEYIARTAPWALAKDPARRADLHLVLTTALQAFAGIASVLKPILPATIGKVEQYLGTALEPGKPAALEGRTLATYSPLFTRIDPKLIDAMTEASRDTLAAAPAPAQSEKKAEAKKSEAPAAAAAPTDAPQYIGIEDFARLDLRIGKVLECGFVDGSDKLLRFLLDAGELGQRQIFSGIRASYGEPEKLVGRNVVFIQPRPSQDALRHQRRHNPVGRVRRRRPRPARRRHRRPARHAGALSCCPLKPQPHREASLSCPADGK